MALGAAIIAVKKSNFKVSDRVDVSLVAVVQHRNLGTSMPSGVSPIAYLSNDVDFFVHRCFDRFDEPG